MDAALAGLIGAGIGSCATLIANVSQSRREAARLRAQFEDQRNARLLNRRIEAHQALFAALTTKTVELGRSIDLEPDTAVEPLDDFVGNAWDAVQIVATPSVAKLGDNAMEKVFKVIQEGKIDKSLLREANCAIVDYQRALHKEIGVIK